MNVEQAIFGRRSVRRYLDEPVDSRRLKKLLEAGFAAPSGSNRQNWFFSVITRKTLLQELETQGKQAVVQYAAPEYQKAASAENYRLLHGAPCLILVSFDPKLSTGPVDAALAAENICLAAYELGLGTCINGLINYLLNQPEQRDLRARCGIREGFLNAMGISVGIPDGSHPGTRPRDKTKIAWIDGT